jgi:hypothetical protein
MHTPQSGAYICVAYVVTFRLQLNLAGLIGIVKHFSVEKIGYETSFSE